MASLGEISWGGLLVVLPFMPLIIGLRYPTFFWRQPFLANLKQKARLFDTEVVSLDLLLQLRKLLQDTNPEEDLNLKHFRGYNGYGQKLVCAHHLNGAAEDFVESVREKLFVGSVISVVLVFMVVLQVAKTGSVTAYPALVLVLSFLSPISVAGVLMHAFVMHQEFRKQVRRYRDVLV